ncbi:hypothetical protein [Azospirillum sp. TSO5]|uniref:hypothetical protein n=1 Tax=Azospirillum sp. TSO5 TaxID=716760 RepID=UPI001304BBED|nr:hypothetical protein [Azospirillum sp. TSO5]
MNAREKAAAEREITDLVKRLQQIADGSPKATPNEQADIRARIVSLRAGLAGGR